MNRRTFLAAVAALPFVKRFVKAEPKPGPFTCNPADDGAGEYVMLCFAPMPGRRLCLNESVRMPDGKWGNCKLHAMPTRGCVRDRVRIYGDDAHLYSSTGPWFLTK